MAIIRDAAIEVRKPTMFGELIIAVVYLPILALQGTEGKLFRPMALTVLFALAGSLVLSLTLMPVLASLRLPRKLEEKEVWLIRLIKWIYQPLVARVVRHPVITVGTVASRSSRSASRSACESGSRVHAAAGRRRPAGRSGPAAQRLAGRLRADVDADREHPQGVSRGEDGLLQDRPAGDRQRRDGRPSDRRLGHAASARRMARRRRLATS